MPKVSVIVPNYNHVRFLPQRIESVLHQTYSDFELLILDDVSPDNRAAGRSSPAGLAVTDSTIVDDNNTVLGIHGRDLKIDGPFGAYSMPSIGADYVQPGRDYCRNHMIPWNTIRVRAAAKGESHIEFDCRDARGVEDLPRSAVGRPNLQSHAGGREGHASQKHVMSRACITFTAFATATPRLGSVGQHRHVAPHS